MREGSISCIEGRWGNEASALQGSPARPGGYSPYHTHPWEHEVFILEGKGTLVQGEKDVPFSKGDVIFIPAGEGHQLRNPSKEPLEFICLIPNPK
jgi:quercetin dioxygenase-like cupin family protein